MDHNRLRGRRRALQSGAALAGAAALDQPPMALQPRREDNACSMS